MANTKPERYPISEQARKKISDMLAQRRRLDEDMATYVTGLKDMAGLEGKWMLDPKSMHLVPIDKAVPSQSGIRPQDASE